MQPLALGVALLGALLGLGVVSCSAFPGGRPGVAEPQPPTPVAPPPKPELVQPDVPQPPVGRPRSVPAVPAEAAPRPAGQEPQPLPPLVVTQLDDRPLVQDLEARPFSLLIAEPVPIKDLLLVLVRDTSLSVVPDPEIEGTFVGELKNVTLRQALELVLHPLDLDYSVQDSFIRVFKRRLETRIFEVNYVLTRRAARRSLIATSGGAPAGVVGDPIGGSSTQVTASEDGDLFRELTAGVRTLLSDQGKFNLDRKAALLQVTDFPDRLDKVGVYLETVQVRVHRQVRIQAQVVEVELGEEFSAGIDWRTVLRDASGSVTLLQDLPPSAPASLTLGVQVRDFASLLTALGNQGEVDVLSSPRVVAMNNEPVVMRVGTRDVFFVTTSQVDATTGRVLQTTVAPRAVTEGLVLTVTPQISADGIINMSISPSVTARTGEVRSRLGDIVPILSVRETDTLVRVREGETIIIAGLMQPGARPAEPAEANQSEADESAFGDEDPSAQPEADGRAAEERRRKTELIILLSPTIVRPAVRATTQD